MGYKLDITIEKEYIDTGPGGVEYFHDAVHVTGNGIADTVCFESGGATVGMSLKQFEQMMIDLMKSSVSLGIRDEIRELLS